MSPEVTIRPFKETDAIPMAALANNLKVWQNVRDYFPYPYKLIDAERFIALALDESPYMVFAVTYNGEFAGVIGLVAQTDVYRFSAEIGYWFGEPFWNKGVATEAVRKIITYAFKELNLARLFTGVFEYNTASMKVLEKAGFEKEAVFKKAVFKNGQFWDEHRYALLKTTN